MTANDKAEIIEVLNMYAFALDTRQWDLFDRVFTEDVEAVFGPAGAAWQGLPVFKKSFAEFHATLDSHAHTMMGQLVEVDQDTAHAFSYGQWLLVRDAAQGGPQWLGTGWYDDLLVRTDAGWRIKKRVCRLLSWTGNPLVPEPKEEHQPDMKAKALHEYAAAGEIGFLKAVQSGAVQGASV